jgi:tetratricopeptide (TPR) repeat protein
LRETFAVNTPNRSDRASRLRVGLAVLVLAAAASAQEPVALPGGAEGSAAETVAAEAVVEAPQAAAEAIPGADAVEPIEAPDHVPAGNLLDRAWHDSADSLESRVEFTRRAAFEVGAWNLDAAALALIEGVHQGAEVDRATAAVRLAPDLPAAHMALARARWLEGEDPMAAVRSVVSGLQSIPRHSEASLWFAGTALYDLALGLVGGGLLLILLAALIAAPRAAHDVAHMWPGGASAPAFARFAGLGALLLTPLALGEGVLGLALALLVVGMLYGTGGRRFALSLAVLGLYAGLYPVPWLAGIALDAFPGDPVLRAAHSATHGVASAVDLARLENAASHDDLAVRALAVHARQTGNLARADALYQRLLANEPDDLTTINNAANVRVDLGHVDRALELYDRALAQGPSAVVLFNLSQTYGRSFQVDELNRTLAEAQRVDGDLVAEFTLLQRTKNEGFVVDLPISVSPVWKRALGRRQAGEALAVEFRAPVAPGALGASRETLAAALGLVLGFGWLLGARFTPSSGCERCGERMCPRCDGTSGMSRTCASCTRLFYQPEKTERTLRAGRIETLQERERRLGRIATALSMFVPGAAGWLAARPLLGYIGTFAFALAAAFLAGWQGRVPDPGVAGTAGPVAFLSVAAVCGLFYLATVAASRTAEES